MKAVKVVQGPGAEIFWAGDDIVGVAAVDEGTAEDAVRAIKVEYQVLPHMVDDWSEPKARRKISARSRWTTLLICSRIRSTTMT